MIREITSLSHKQKEEIMRDYYSEAITSYAKEHRCDVVEAKKDIDEGELLYGSDFIYYYANEQWRILNEKDS